MTTTCASFAERPTTFAGVREHGGWRIKAYDITLPGAALDAAMFESGVAMALDALPQPARADGRPGLALLIRHQGATGDYVVVAWWGNTNELPIKVWLRGGDGFRPATGDESFCVYDLRVIWAEREAYVATMLADPARPDVEAYLARTL